MLLKPLRIFNFSTFLQTQILMLPVLLFFYQENGLEKSDLFLFQGIFSITALLFEVPAGYIGDIFPRKNILIFSYALFLMRLILWICFRGYWIVLAGEILYSMSKAFYSGVADAYVYDYLKTQGKNHRMLHGYGKLNFCMSVGTALASLVGPFLYAKYGFVVLISIEIILNTTSIFLLFLLPQVPSTHKKIKNLKSKYRELFQITKDAIKNVNLRYYMLYSGILAGTTTVFVWSFQPIMEIIAIPVVFFGIVFFLNHAFRALASILLPHTLSFCSLKKIGIIAYTLFISSFLLEIAILYFKPEILTMTSPTFVFSIFKYELILTLGSIIGLIALTFICIVIGFQLTFTLGQVSRLHSLVASDIRSTVSSVNNLISRGISGILLICLKFLFDGISLEKALLVYMVIFGLSIIPLRKIMISSDKIQ